MSNKVSTPSVLFTIGDAQKTVLNQKKGGYLCEVTPRYVSSVPRDQLDFMERVIQLQHVRNSASSVVAGDVKVVLNYPAKYKPDAQFTIYVEGCSSHKEAIEHTESYIRALNTCLESLGSDLIEEMWQAYLSRLTPEAVQELMNQLKINSFGHHDLSDLILS